SLGVKLPSRQCSANLPMITAIAPRLEMTPHRVNYRRQSLPLSWILSPPEGKPLAFFDLHHNRLPREDTAFDDGARILFRQRFGRFFSPLVGDDLSSFGKQQRSVLGIVSITCDEVNHLVLQQ